MTATVSPVSNFAASATGAVPRAPLDPESREWIASLGADGAVREDAVARLHALLLRAARFEVRQRGAGARGRHRVLRT